jgi:tetrahydromethanopterin S-methyltransferase subunit A
VTTTLKKRLENVAGRLCEVLIPIKHEYYIGEGKIVADCTSADVMNRILIVGRLLSENKGMDFT